MGVYMFSVGLTRIRCSRVIHVQDPQRTGRYRPRSNSELIVPLRIASGIASAGTSATPPCRRTPMSRLLCADDARPIGPDQFIELLYRSTSGDLPRRVSATHLLTYLRH